MQASVIFYEMVAVVAAFCISFASFFYHCNGCTGTLIDQFPRNREICENNKLQLFSLNSNVTERVREREREAEKMCTTFENGGNLKPFCQCGIVFVFMSSVCVCFFLHEQ